MTRYPSYKPSGISWIGEIPSHWEEKRLSSKFHDKVLSNSDYLFTRAHKFNYGTLVPKNEFGDVSEYKETYLDYSVIKRGDIVINGLNLNYDFVSQRVAIATEDCIITRAYLPIRPYKDTNSDFYVLLLKAMDSKKLFHGMGNGIRLTLSFKELKSQSIPVPPLAEQNKIVEFLSTKTSLIDAQQRERERELRLLDELKQAEIANVVTRGLNPDVPMRTTQIPWLNEIPSHWNERRAKYLFVKENRPVREEDDVVTCFRDGQVTLRKNRRTEGFTESFKEYGYQGIRKGDLVVHQMDAFAGSSGVSDSDGKSTPVYIVCTPVDDNVYTPYFALILRRMGLNGYIQSLYRGIRERSSNFSYDVFCAQLLPVPPIEEQKAIVEYIQRKARSIDEMIANLKEEIDFLSEYKQRLIADVVTGQIKVD